MATFAPATSEDPTAASPPAVRQRGSPAPRGGIGAPLPEVQAYLRELVEAHYEAWVDDPLPALAARPRAKRSAPHSAARASKSCWRNSKITPDTAQCPT